VSDVADPRGGDAPGDVTVLLVDDQDRFREVARTVVERTPGLVLVGEAIDGQGAVEQAARLRPMLVLMDIHLPGVGGLDATARIVAEHPETVVVLLSSYDRDDLPEGAMESGARAYLHKEELAPSALTALWREHGVSLGT
jgi:DNA-binding NarL/FixJ family response regulator